MSSLHTVKGSPANHALDTCVTLLGPGDALLFLDDGAYYCTAPEMLTAVKTGVDIFVLKDDLIARGISEKVPSGIRVVDYGGFVDLCCEHDIVVSWF